MKDMVLFLLKLVIRLNSKIYSTPLKKYKQTKTQSCLQGLGYDSDIQIINHHIVRREQL
jgi:ABC-type siderophore export system fused ATPase/permease subunit